MCICLWMKIVNKFYAILIKQISNTELFCSYTNLSYIYIPHHHQGYKIVVCMTVCMCIYLYLLSFHFLLRRYFFFISFPTFSLFTLKAKLHTLIDSFGLVNIYVSNLAILYVYKCMLKFSCEYVCVEEYIKYTCRFIYKYVVETVHNEKKYW